MDANNDGKMTRGESMAAGGSEEDFSATDVDDSGDIDKGELQDFLAIDIMARVRRPVDAQCPLSISSPVLMPHVCGPFPSRWTPTTTGK